MEEGSHGVLQGDGETSSRNTCDKRDGPYKPGEKTSKLLEIGVRVKLVVEESLRKEITGPN